MNAQFPDVKSSHIDNPGPGRYYQEQNERRRWERKRLTDTSIGFNSTQKRACNRKICRSKSLGPGAYDVFSVSLAHKAEELPRSLVVALERKHQDSTFLQAPLPAEKSRAQIIIKFQPAASQVLDTNSLSIPHFDPQASAFLALQPMLEAALVFI